MEYKIQSIGREKAIELHESKWWELCESPREIVAFQLFIEELTVPIGIYKQALNQAFGRPVYVHEIISDDLKAEFLGDKEPPTIEEIINMIPEEKRIIIQPPSEE